MRLRHVACLLTVACVAQLSTGCHLVRNTFWRIRNAFGCCDTCAPAFHNPGPVMSGPAYGGAAYGAPDCASCSGYPGMPVAGQPIVMHGTIPQMPAGAAPSVGLPMPKDAEKK
jgi:hypothetical protein